MTKPYSTAPWEKRRRLIHGILVFCALGITYILWRALDLRIYETALLGFFALAGSTIGSYIFGAVWDDNNARSTQRHRHRDRADEPDPATTPPDDYPGGQ